MRQPTFTLDSFDQTMRPCVYAWRRGDAWLYVGMSGLGLRRPFSRHHVIGVTEPIAAMDRLDVWVFPTPAEASAFEAELIREQRPRHNTHVPSISGPNGDKGNRVPLNCLVAPQTKELIELMAQQRGISQGVLIDWALQEQEIDATDPPKAAKRYDVKDAKTIMVEKIPDASPEGQLRSTLKQPAPHRKQSQPRRQWKGPLLKPNQQRKEQK